MLERARQKLDHAFASTDELATRVARAGKSWLLWPVLYAVALGAGGWSFYRNSLLSTIDTNKLGDGDRKQALIWVAGAAAALLVVHLAAIAVRRVRSGEWRTVETVSLLDRWLTPALAVPCLGYLRLAGIERDSPKLSLFLAAACAFVAGKSVYHWTRALGPARPDADDAPRPRFGWASALLAGAVVVGLWAAYGYFFSRLAITHHHALATRTTDLGYYDNIFYSSIHGKPLGCSFVKAGTHVSAHFDPVLILLSPLYLLYPRAELLLVLQSVWLGSGVIPAYLIGRRVLESRVAGVVFATMLAVYPAMHGANMYEFHSLTLIAPLVLWLLYFLETRATKRYFLVLALLLLCREDVPLLMCVVGFYAIVSQRPNGARMGIATIALSVAYFVVAKGVFMKSSGILNAGKDAYSYDYYYDALNPSRTGAGGLVASLLTNPIFALKTALDEPKIIYVLLLFLPLAALPFAAKPGRVMLVYGLLFTTLASRQPVFSIHFQYSSVIYPIAFFLTAIALRQVKEGRLAGALDLDGRRLWKALLGAAFAASLIVSWKFGGVVENRSFKGGFSTVVRSLSEEQKKTYAWVDETARSIPRTASVGATNKLGPHVSNRKTAVFWPEKMNVDYVFLDESELKAGDLEKHNRAIARKDIVEVSRLGKMALYKRKGL